MTCSVEQELYFDDLKNIWGPISNQRYPISGTIELTERCNYTCQHCFINKPANDLTARQTEMSTAQVKSVIDQLADAGTLFLLITGGEPLIRSDFLEIFRYARQKGMIITLFTNGSLLTDEIAASLAEYGIRGIEISIYGVTPGTFEAVTRSSGSFERCMRGIDSALKYKLPLSLKTFVMTINQHELGQMRTIAEKYHLKFRFDSMLWPRIDHTGNGHHLQLNIKEMIKLDLEDPERLNTWRELMQKHEGEKINSELIFHCGAAYQSFHIDAIGNLSPCAMVRRPCYNILKSNFSTAWEKLGEVRDLKRTKKSECVDCPYVILCNHCTGWSQNVMDDLETPVPFICELTKQRMQAIRNHGIN